MSFNSNIFINKCINIKKNYTLDSLFKKYNVKLIYTDFEKVFGFTTVFLGNNIIYINENLKNIEKNFIIYHELAHIIFHNSESRAFNKNLINCSYETEANLFATIMTDSVYKDNIYNSKIQKIINYIYCTYLINNNNYIRYIDYDYID